MSVCCERCLLSVRGPCVGLITRPEKSYQVVSEYNFETWTTRRAGPEYGRCSTQKKKKSPEDQGVFSSNGGAAQSDGCFITVCTQPTSHSLIVSVPAKNNFTKNVQISKSGPHRNAQLQTCELFVFSLITFQLNVSFLLWCDCPPVGQGLLIIEDSWAHSDTHTHTHTHTLGRTLLEEWSAQRGDLYLTTHNTHNRHKFKPLVGFETAISASEQPQTHAFRPRFHQERQMCPYFSIFRVSHRQH